MRSCNIIHDAHVKVPPSVFCLRCMWHVTGIHWLCWLLLTVLIAFWPNRKWLTLTATVTPVSQVDLTDSTLATIIGAAHQGPVYLWESPPAAAAQSTDTTCGEEVSLSNNWSILHPLLAY